MKTGWENNSQTKKNVIFWCAEGYMPEKAYWAFLFEVTISVLVLHFASFRDADAPGCRREHIS